MALNLSNCIVDKVSSMKDGSVRVSLTTRALSPTQMAELFYSVNKEVLAVEIEEENTDTKSPSQRLRNSLYVLWNEQADKKTYPEFELYYRAKMERIIDTVKDKLN